MQPHVRASPPHHGQEVQGRFVISPAFSLPAPNLKDIPHNACFHPHSATHPYMPDRRSA
jgi:hypothetical protein